MTAQEKLRQVCEILQEVSEEASEGEPGKLLYWIVYSSGGGFDIASFLKGDVSFLIVNLIMIYEEFGCDIPKGIFSEEFEKVIMDRTHRKRNYIQ